MVESKQADAEENIRLLLDKGRQEEALKNLTACSFYELPDLLSIANSLLSSLTTTEHGGVLLRKCVNALVQRNIDHVRTPALDQFIKNIELVLQKTHDLDYLMDLDLCILTLRLISEDPKRVAHLVEKLPAKKSSMRMVHVIDAYKSIGVHWKKQWFAEIIKLENLFQKVIAQEEDLETLRTLKRYIYENIRVNWRFMYSAFRGFTILMMSKVSDDVRGSAYLEGMSGGSSIKLPCFADPTPVLSPRIYYAPLLPPKARYAAVKFLMALTRCTDDTIAEDARKHLERYSNMEKNEKIKELYQLFFNKPEPTPVDRSKETPLPEAIKTNVIQQISSLSNDPFPVDAFEQMTKLIHSGAVIESSIEMDPKQAGFCRIKQAIRESTLTAMNPMEHLQAKKDMLILLEKVWQFNSRKPKTWPYPRALVYQLEYLLKSLTPPFPEEFQTIFHKLKFFYEKTPFNKSKLKFYSELCSQCTAKSFFPPVLSSDKAIFSLNPSDYGEFFDNWKKENNLHALVLTRCIYTDDGNNVLFFSTKLLTGMETGFRVQTKRKQIEIKEEHQNEPSPYTSILEKMGSSSYLNALAKMYEAMVNSTKKKFVTADEAFLIVNFFESFLLGNNPCRENIIISALYFTALFGLVLDEHKWGLPTATEFQTILDRKLCLSFVYQFYGSKYAEETYANYNNKALKEGSLVLIPRRLTIPKSKQSQSFTSVSDFYNAIWRSSQDFRCPVLSEAYGKVIDDLKNYENARTIFYECSLAFQKALLTNPNRCTFSVNRSSIYINVLEKNLLELERIHLKDFIHCILAHTDMNLGRNRFDLCLQLLQSVNTVLPSIHTDKKETPTEQKQLSRSLHRMIAIAECVLARNSVRLDAQVIDALCNLYVFADSCGEVWPAFEKVLNSKLEVLASDDPFKSILSMKVLMKNSVKFYVLNGQHCPKLLRQTCELFEKGIFHQLNNKVFLSRFIQEAFPISLILWESPLNDYFFKCLESVMAYHNQCITDISLNNIIENLNIIQILRNNLKTLTEPKKIMNIKRSLDYSYEIFTSNLIQYYIVPGWYESEKTHGSEKIKTLLDALSFQVKEDATFLEQLEEKYQKHLFANGPNPCTLESILKDMWTRFNHKPSYLKLKPCRIRTYRHDGTLFEEREGYDIFGLIFGVNNAISYLKLEGNKTCCLYELILPTFVHGEILIVGFGGGGKMKLRINQLGLPTTMLLPLVTKEELTVGKILEILKALRFKEAYYYWQRMFNPISPNGDVVTGQFTVLYMDDESVTFGNITNADGCGFIKASTLGVLYQKLLEFGPYSLRKPIQTYQAIQHNKRGTSSSDLFDAAVTKCVQNTDKIIGHYLEECQADQSSVKGLFSSLTTGGVARGRNFVTIPACGKDNIILPVGIKEGNFCLTKTPVEKPLDSLLKEEREICHKKSKDEQKKKAADSIANTVGFQYSFIGTNGSSLDFTKGILVVIPDDLWPYPKIDMMLNRKDLKVSSRWTELKEHYEHRHVETYCGVLTPTHKYGPGSFIALSSNIQIERCNGDFDGDISTITAISPEVSLLLSKTIECSPPYTTPKIPKTFTKSGQNGRFNIFRFSSIVGSRTANLLMLHSKFYDVFMALKQDYQEKVARTIASVGIAENLIKHILTDDTDEAIHDMIHKKPVLFMQKILSAGIKTGADSFKSKVDWTYFKEFARIIDDVYDNLGIPTALAYSKKLCIGMHRTEINFSDVRMEAEYQMRFFDSLPLHILHKTLTLMPEYKMRRLSQLLVKQMENDGILKEALKQNPSFKTKKDRLKFLRRQTRAHLKKIMPEFPSFASQAVQQKQPQNPKQSNLLEKSISFTSTPNNHTRCFYPKYCYQWQQPSIRPYLPMKPLSFYCKARLAEDKTTRFRGVTLPPAVVIKPKSELTLLGDQINSMASMIERRNYKIYFRGPFWKFLFLR